MYKFVKDVKCSYSRSWVCPHALKISTIYFFKNDLKKVTPDENLNGTSVTYLIGDEWKFRANWDLTSTRSYFMVLIQTWESVFDDISSTEKRVKKTQGLSTVFENWMFWCHEEALTVLRACVLLHWLLFDKL